MELFKKKQEEKLYGTPLKNNQEDPNFLQDLIRLLFKVACIGLCFVLVFSFIFGAFRYNDLSMQPAVKDGDMVLSYRWDKRYQINDLIVFWYEEKPLVGRVIATADHVVDINPSGSVIVDGNSVVEENIYSETTQLKGGVTFPIKVEPGYVFVLGDNRKSAIDSRTVGCIEIDKTDGKVIGLFRHRGF